MSNRTQSHTYVMLFGKSKKEVIHAEIFGTKAFVTIVNENKKMIVTNETILKSSIVDYYSFYTLNLAQLQKNYL